MIGTIANSRIEYGAVPKNVKKNSDFSVEFKTYAPDGLIFYTQSAANIDHIALYLRDGKVCSQMRGRLLGITVFFVFSAMA